MLTNKVVVIIGGAGLIGQEFVRAVIENNGKVVIADLNEEIAKEIKDNINKELKSTNVYFEKVDISSAESVSSLISLIDKKHGKIDALVNTAFPRNKNYGNHFFDVDLEDFNFHLNLNVGGYFLTSQKFSEYFVKQGYGNIINIASIYGVVAPRFEIYEDTTMTTAVEYVAIKAGLIHLSKYIAKYLKGKNIRVNCISPGGIFDNQDKNFLEEYKNKCLNKGMLDAKDMKGTLVFLLSDSSKYINGQNIIVDDGFVL